MSSGSYIRGDSPGNSPTRVTFNGLVSVDATTAQMWANKGSFTFNGGATGNALTLAPNAVLHIQDQGNTGNPVTFTKPVVLGAGSLLNIGVAQDGCTAAVTMTDLTLGEGATFHSSTGTWSTFNGLTITGATTMGLNSTVNVTFEHNSSGAGNTTFGSVAMSTGALILGSSPHNRPVPMTFNGLVSVDGTNVRMQSPASSGTFTFNGGATGNALDLAANAVLGINNALAANVTATFTKPVLLGAGAALTVGLGRTDVVNRATFTDREKPCRGPLRGVRALYL